MNRAISAILASGSLIACVSSWAEPPPPPPLPTPFPGPSSTAQAQPSRGTAERPPIALAQGEQRRLRFPGLARYSLAGTVAKILPLGPELSRQLGHEARDELLIQASHPGETDLWVWTATGETFHQAIEVEAAPRGMIDPALARALSRLEETEIVYSGDGVILRGEIHGSEELARIAAMAEGSSRLVRDETEPSPELLARLESDIRAWSARAGFADRIRIDRIGSSLRITGSLVIAKDREIVARKIHEIDPEAQLDLEALPDDHPTVHFKVFLLELKKSKFRQLGLDWPGTTSGAFRVSTWGIQQQLQFDVALEALEGEGAARVLSNPELVVRAPGEAELFAGGEVPIKTTSAYSSEVTWRQYGLELKLKVTDSTSEKVRLEIQTEVSHLAPELGRDDLPGLEANRIRTQVDAFYGRPLFLSGMLQEDLRSQSRGLPFLRSLPILGALFGSDDWVNQRSELVAVLLPNRDPPPAPMEQFAERMSPLGEVPPPRNWITPDEERKLRDSNDYPWNALQ